MSIFSKQVTVHLRCIDGKSTVIHGVDNNIKYIYYGSNDIKNIYII